MKIKIKKKVLLVLFLVMLIPFVYAQAGIFGPRTPPGSPPGILCAPTGCIVNGDIDFQGNTIFNLSIFNAMIFNSFIYNTTIINITVLSSYDWSNVSINSSQVLDFNESVEAVVEVKEENVSISVTGGSGSGSTSICCTPTAEILQIAVYPTTPANTYRFNADGSISGDDVDTNRISHTGDWIIAHRGSTLINENINLDITSANIDETFRVRVRWRI